MNAVLCVDDQEEELQSLRFLLADRYRIITCRDPVHAAAIVQSRKPDVVVLDIEMPEYDGFRVLADIRALENPPPVMILSAHPEPFFVIRALRGGAADFLSKPYSGAMLRRQIDRLLPEYGSGVPAGTGRDRSIAERVLIGSSPPMVEIRRTLAAYARSDAPVLILGESGTGKDKAALVIHALSPRAAGPFEVRNMAAMPESIAESELFGCEPGAFTDARDRQGCFEAAHGGTLFLDEIAEAAPTVQAALLRIVEDGLIRRLGAAKPKKSDCRLVFATNRDLNEAAKEKSFRKDLLYRINILPLVMPPLRERREDIPELVAAFLSSNGRQSEGIDDSAMDFLGTQAWPGNVRQLKACIERALVLSGGGRIGADHLKV